MATINNKIESSIRAFRTPIVSPDTGVREVSSASFGDLVRMLAEGIADAQVSLDRASAEMAVELANQKINVIPSVTETIDEKGNVTYKQGDPQEVSLLDIGITPTFYQFSQATVEVAMDLKIVENLEETGERKSRFSLFADTSSVRFERKLNRDLTVSSKLTATMVPVPMPLRMDPVRTTITPETK